MALVLQGLCKRFDNSEKDTLHEIDLEVKTGEFVCIVGASGCGKSTLLNLVAGLEQPTQGKVLLDGAEVTKPGADRTVMFQEHGLFPWLNVLENVKFGMKLAGVSKDEQEEKARRYLEMMNLWEYRDYPIHQLSGGMRRRVSILRALLAAYDVLCLDEPFKGLDDARKEQTLAYVKQKAAGRTVLFVTHDEKEALALGAEVILLP